MLWKPSSGTIPGELHKLWKASTPGSYHMEYGFSCMGYEIAGAMGATRVKVCSIAELEEALAKRADAKGPYVIVIDTDPYPSTEPGGTWWDVGVPEVSDRAEVNAARANSETNKKLQRAD